MNHLGFDVAITLGLFLEMILERDYGGRSQCPVVFSCYNYYRGIGIAE